MTPQELVVDTNVIVSAMMNPDRSSPPRRILAAMLGGSLPYLISSALFAEYSRVLRRPGLLRRHDRPSLQIDRLLLRLIENGTWRHPTVRVEFVSLRGG